MKTMRRFRWLPGVTLSFCLCLPACGGGNEGTEDDTFAPDNGKADDWASDKRIPTLADEVQQKNQYCIYQDKLPYVKKVNWTHPRIQAAMSALANGYRSTFSYSDWKVPYGLESEKSDDPVTRQQAVVRNFIRTLCGEFRDYPSMLKKKLDSVTNAQVYAPAGEMQSVDTSKNLFTQITYKAYMKMTNVMRTMHSYRQQKLEQACQAEPVCAAKEGWNYNFGEEGHNCNRVQRSVPPWTHCEMKFMFEKYMTAGAPSSVNGDQYEQEFAQYKTTDCTDADFETMYNFRGHKNFKPLWLESNAMIWNSRRARKVAIAHDDHEYYRHPFASRVELSRQALAAYLFYPDAAHQAMRQASEGGGGPILYVTDQDKDGDNVADYRLFDQDGCGDQGVAGTNPDDNCNMVSWDEAFAMPSVTGHASSWKPEWYSDPDMGFLRAFPTFEERMARFNQALDRHTNWGPTSYYMLGAAKPGAKPNQIPYQGAYSPIVACSYDISASHSFASGSYSGVGDPFESGQTKWMFIMRFPTKHYYDEQMMAEGKPFDFINAYFNETSLSNDYYSERALDRFGFVPLPDVHAQVYFVYGNRGEAVPEAPVIPPPPGDLPAPTEFEADPADEV